MRLRFVLALTLGALSVAGAPGCTAVVFDANTASVHGKEYRIPDPTTQSGRFSEYAREN